LAQDFAKAHGSKALDVMSRNVISVRPDTNLRDLADMLDKHRVKRVPVLDAGRLVGIVTRGDLVRALSQVQITRVATKLDNAALHRKLHDRIHEHSWINPGCISLAVEDGAVELWGFVDTIDQRNALRVLIEETDGVARVVEHVNVGAPFQGGM
jgi:CBS domain-containing protein